MEKRLNELSQEIHDYANQKGLLQKLFMKEMKMTQN